jgi:predicted O-linked N-acetylglucosamine transferase (SPINDLY family)
MVLPVVYDSTDDLMRWRTRIAEVVGRLADDGVQNDTTRSLVPTNFFVAYQGENDAALARDLGRIYRGVDLCNRSSSPQAAHGSRIRVGFVSAYFRDHTIGRLNLGRIQHLARDQFDVTVISAGRHRDDTARAFQQAADRFVELPRQVEVARRQIAELGLDILVFAEVGMDALTYTLAFSRMAPVQCVTWGHPDTTGSPTMDYFLSSELLETADADAHYTERLVRLPNLGTYYYRPKLAGPARSRKFFGLPDGRHIYLCPQTLFKFHPEFDGILRGILRSDPQGELVLLDGRVPNWTRRLRERFAGSLGNVADRVRFLPAQPHADFLQLLSLAEVVLDPIHFGGGNTSYEALALGVPIVTWPGAFLRGRITQALYRKMDLTECVVASAAEYTARAVAIGGDRDIRESVADRIQAANHLLFEDIAEVQALEHFLKNAV